MSSAIGGREAATALAGAVVLAVNAFIAVFPVDDPCLLFESAVDVVRQWPRCIRRLYCRIWACGLGGAP